MPELMGFGASPEKERRDRGNSAQELLKALQRSRPGGSAANDITAEGSLLGGFGVILGGGSWQMLSQWPVLDAVSMVMSAIKWR